MGCEGVRSSPRLYLKGAQFSCAGQRRLSTDNGVLCLKMPMQSLTTRILFVFIFIQSMGLFQGLEQACIPNVNICLLNKVLLLLKKKDNWTRSGLVCNRKTLRYSY